jgi:signal transduction histidine kinase
MIWLSEKRRLVVFISILLLSGFFLTSIIGYQVSKTTLKDIIFQSELPLTGDNIYSEIQRDLLPPISIASVMAQDTFLRDWVINGENDQTLVSKYLGEIKQKYEAHSAFFVSEQSRTYYLPDGKFKTLSPHEPEDEWYYRVREMIQDFEINVEPDVADKGVMTIFINHKVYDYDGRYIGATGIGLDVNTVQKLIDSYAQKYQRHIMLIDRNGDIVIAKDRGRGTSSNIADMPGLGAITKQILLTTSGSFEYDTNGETYLLAARYVPELKWILLVEQSESQAVKGLKKTLVINLMISLVVTIIVLAATFVAIDIYQKRLHKMADEEKFMNDQLRHLNEQKDKVLSIIGHDLRSPFNAVIGYAELLSDKSRTLEREQITEYAVNIAQSGRNANALLDSLLNWARFQWGNLVPEPSCFNVGEVIDHNLLLFNPNADVKNIDLQEYSNVNTNVIADQDMVDFVIRNLLNNAVKFTNSGGKISVDLSKVNDMAWVSINDTGTGIPADQINNLFENENNRSTTGTAGEAGIGMGLTLCRDMIEANGGEITVESEVGVGSTFRVSLPLDKS